MVVCRLCGQESRFGYVTSESRLGFDCSRFSLPGKLEKEKGDKQKAAAEKYLVECTDHKLQSVMRVKAWRDELHYSTTGHVRLDTAIELAKETPGPMILLRLRGLLERFIDFSCSHLCRSEHVAEGEQRRRRSSDSSTSYDPQDYIPRRDSTLVPVCWRMIEIELFERSLLVLIDSRSLLVSQLLNEVPNNSHPFDLYLYGVTKMYPTKVARDCIVLFLIQYFSHAGEHHSSLVRLIPRYHAPTAR